MKKVLNLIPVAALAVTIFACSQPAKTGDTKSNTTPAASAPANTATAGAATAKVLYRCPMDTDVTSNKPGTCSKCGMDLEKVEKK